jgi:hypothetical protein
MKDRPAVWAALLGLAAVLLPWTNSHLGDYTAGDPHANNPAPAISALADGDFGEFARVQPVMGLTSLLLRAPLVALAGDRDLLAYRLGCAACLLAAAAVAFWVQREMAARGSAAVPRLLVSGLIVAGPPTLDALKLGHPEEPLGAALSVAAVLAAVRARPALAGAMLGLAVGTKPSFALAAAPVLLVAEAPGRRRLVAAAALLAAVTVLPGPLGDTDRFRDASRTLGREAQVRAWSIWYPAAEHRPLTVTYGPGDVDTIVRHRLPGGITRSQALLAGGLLIAVLLALLWRSLPVRDPDDALALLALALLARCMLDPFNIGYYHAPALMALAAWEGLRFRRLPALSVAAAALFLASFPPSDMADSLTLQTGSLALKCALYLAWTGALAAYLVRSLRIPGGPDRPAAAARLRSTGG